MFTLLSLFSLTTLGANTSTVVRTCCIPLHDSGSSTLEPCLAGARLLGGTPLCGCASLHVPDVDGWALVVLAAAGLSHLSSVTNAWSVSNVIIHIDRCYDPALSDADSALWRRLLIAGGTRLQDNFPSPITRIRDSNLLAVTPMQIRPGCWLLAGSLSQPALSHFPHRLPRWNSSSSHSRLSGKQFSPPLFQGLKLFRCDWWNCHNKTDKLLDIKHLFIWFIQSIFMYPGKPGKAYADMQM